MTTLRQAVEEYLVMRRSLGFRLAAAGKALRHFVAYMEDRHATYVTLDLALAWARQPTNVQSVYWAIRLGYVRAFAQYRRAADPRTQVPGPEILPFRPRRSQPYLYSTSEIDNLLRAALNLRCYRGYELRPWMFHCLFGLLSVSGLRIGEARKLELQDVDLKAGILTIRGAKFGKSRLVPIHLSTCRVLADYIERRRRHFEGKHVSSYLFVTNHGNPLDTHEPHRVFYALSRQIGLRRGAENRGPRIHDLRHTFAVSTLVRWYRLNRDTQRCLPILASYLGHTTISDTQWYLTACPQLLGEAMRRAERRWEKTS